MDARVGEPNGKNRTGNSYIETRMLHVWDRVLKNYSANAMASLRTTTSFVRHRPPKRTEMMTFQLRNTPCVCVSREKGCLSPRSRRPHALKTTTCRRRPLSSSLTTRSACFALNVCSANAAIATARRLAILSWSLPYFIISRRIVVMREVCASGPRDAAAIRETYDASCCLLSGRGFLGLVLVLMFLAYFHACWLPSMRYGNPPCSKFGRLFRIRFF